jgi:phosphatidylglycerol:prolipoprotein diacylglycerol transferase
MHPILFKLWKLEIRTYGVMIAIGIILGTIIAMKEGRRKGIRDSDINDFLFYGIIFGIIGARIYYVLFSDPNTYLKNPFDIIAVWKGGLAIHGGVIGGFITAVIFCKKRNISFLKFADTLTPSLILGQGIGRIGCLSAGCCYGVPTSLPWGIKFTNIEAMAPLNIYLHPTQIYEFLLDMIVFIIIWRFRKRINLDGGLFLLYLLSYGIVRFFVEIFRGDKLMIFGLISAAQTMSIIFIISSIIGYLILKSRSR